MLIEGLGTLPEIKKLSEKVPLFDFFGLQVKNTILNEQMKKKVIIESKSNLLKFESTDINCFPNLFLHSSLWPKLTHSSLSVNYQSQLLCNQGAILLNFTYYTCKQSQMYDFLCFSVVKP